MTKTYIKKVTFALNGESFTVDISHHWSLLDLIRERFGLTGAKKGCDRGECGSCTILVDDLAINSCQMLALDIENKAVTTIEGLGNPSDLHPIQKAFLENDSGQCGYCTPGFVMSVLGLLKQNPCPNDTQITKALQGNLCRCNAYGRILKGIQDVVKNYKSDTI